jgi:hypothetical protein
VYYRKHYDEAIEEDFGVNDNVMVNNAEKFSGKFVALRSFWEKDPVCSGSNPADVHKDAQAQGIEEPVVFFVPENDVTYIY